MKIFLLFYAIASVCKFLGKAISCLCKKKPKVEPSAISTARNWYGICDGCGKKDGLHRFEGKRYCAKCHSKLKAEKDLGVKTDPDYWGKRNEHIKRN